MNSISVRKFLKRIGWTLLVLFGVLCVLLFGAVKYLESKDLASVAERLANERITGKLTVGSLRIGFRPGFPFLGLELDSLTVISHAFDGLPDNEKGMMPVYSDSLLSIDHLSGAIDIRRLLVSNEVSLRDVSLRGLSVNIVIAHDGKPNYEILRIEPDSTNRDKKKSPSFSINRFSLDDPKEIRFFNAADSTSASVVLLSDAAVDGSNQPTYRLNLNGNVTSPKATLLTNLEHISFGLNGNVHWDPSSPGLVAMDEMEISGAFIKAVVTGEIDLTDNPIATRGSIIFKPVAVMDLISLLPDSIRRKHTLDKPFFSTDAKISGSFNLTAPMDLTTDTFPSSLIDIKIAPSTLRHGKSRLSDVALDAAIRTLSNMPDSTVIDIKKITINGPATKLNASATVTTPVSDLSFDAKINGRIDLSDLPPLVKEFIPGYLSGLISANLHTVGSASMLHPNLSHRIMADGSLNAHNLYFIAADTSKMVEIGNARIDLVSVTNHAGAPRPKMNLSVDTATVLVSGIDLTFASVGLGLESAGHSMASDIEENNIAPLKGRLKMRRFNIITVKDTAGARISDLEGRLHINLFKENKFSPGISADLTTGIVSAGTKKDKIIIDGAKITANLLKNATADRKSTFDKNPHDKKSYDKNSTEHSMREYAYLSPSAVHRYVYEKRRHGKKTKRVYIEAGPDGDERLVWNLTPQFRSFLDDWSISGSVTSARSRLQSPLLALRNDIPAIDILFNNDTVDIRKISLHAGESDFVLSGVISNVRRAFTSKTDNGLKGNLSILCDCIDINELSSSFFREKTATSGKHTVKSLLVPVNLDARLRLNARRLSYADLDMHNFGGEILVYDGGVNLHDFKAESRAGDLSVTALYSAPRLGDMRFGFGINAKDFNIGELVKLVPAIDSITPLMHDFSGIVGADIAATCMIDSAMNIELPTLNAAVRISGDNLAFIDPEKYRTLGKWLGFKDKTDNTIHRLNVEMTVEDGLLRVYPFAFDIDRYRLGIYGSNNIDMNFDYHLSVLKSPLPFRFGITIKGNPKKYKVRFGGAKFNENTAVESVDIVSRARVNLIQQLDEAFRRGVRNSRFAMPKIAHPAGFDIDTESDLTPADSLQLMRQGILDSPSSKKPDTPPSPQKKKRKRFLFF